MSRLSFFVLFASAVCAATGNILLKMGVNNKERLADFINIPILGGLTVYCVGIALWLLGLSQNNLTIAYPFTALNFVLIYAMSFLVLGEQPPLQAYFGIGLIVETAGSTGQ